jgi:hypothetical protein
MEVTVHAHITLMVDAACLAWSCYTFLFALRDLPCEQAVMQRSYLSHIHPLAPRMTFILPCAPPRAPSNTQACPQCQGAYTQHTPIAAIVVCALKRKVIVVRRVLHMRV